MSDTCVSCCSALREREEMKHECWSCFIPTAVMGFPQQTWESLPELRRFVRWVLSSFFPETETGIGDFFFLWMALISRSVTEIFGFSFPSSLNVCKPLLLLIYIWLSWTKVIFLCSSICQNLNLLHLKDPVVGC